MSQFGWWWNEPPWSVEIRATLARIEDKENLILKLCTDSRLSAADQAKLNRIFEITEADAAKIDGAMKK